MFSANVASFLLVLGFLLMRFMSMSCFFVNAIVSFANVVFSLNVVFSVNAVFSINMMSPSISL